MLGNDAVHKNQRVGIVSLFGLYNFGNRLQGYALDRVLRDLGLNPETLVFYRKLGISVALASVRRWIRLKKGTKQSVRRLERFKDFVAGQRIRYIVSPIQIQMLSRQYDYFFVGSDQVWNPQADLYPGTKLLEFALPEQRIAVSPSFGIDSLQEKVAEDYRAALSQYKALSVREETGSAIIEKLIGKRPPVLADPTLALTAEQWREIADVSMVPSEPYVLAYFLGGWNGILGEYVSSDSVPDSIQIIDLMDVSSLNYGAGPQDFIGLIDNAALVITDSFHASVFSCILETPFRVYRRNEAVSTYSRIETLIHSCGLEDIEGFGPMPRLTLERNKQIVSQLNRRRLDFISYLEGALK